MSNFVVNAVDLATIPKQIQIAGATSRTLGMNAGSSDFGDNPDIQNSALYFDAANNLIDRSDRASEALYPLCLRRPLPSRLASKKIRHALVWTTVPKPLEAAVGARKCG